MLQIPFTKTVFELNRLLGRDNIICFSEAAEVCGTWQQFLFFLFFFSIRERDFHLIHKQTLPTDLFQHIK